MDLGPDVPRRRYLGAVENVMAVRRDAVCPDAPDLEHFQDELAPGPPVEIPATADLGLLPKERQNLQDTVDPKTLRRWAYTRRVLQPGDELAVRQAVQEWCRQTQQVAQPKEMKTQRLEAHRAALAELLVVRR